MKHYQYDTTFYQYTDIQMERMDNLLTSIEYDTMLEQENAGNTHNHCILNVVIYIEII